MGEMDLCLLNCLLLCQRLPHHTPSSRLLQHYHLPLSLHLWVLCLPLKPLVLAHSASIILENSGYQNSGQSLITISRSESQLLSHLQMRMRMRMRMIHSTCSMSTQPLHLNPQLRSDGDLWHKACEEEMEAHRLNGTWEIVKLPPGKRAIGSRWFMKVKHNADGSLDRYKVQRAILSDLALISRRHLLPLSDTPPFTLFLLLLLWRTLNFGLWTSHMHTSMGNSRRRSIEVGGPEYVCGLQKSLY
jgi:hypothetical protein